MTAGVMTVGSEPWPDSLKEVRQTERQDSSAARVLRLLDAFVGLPTLVGVTQLADRVGLPKSTAHRLLLTLTREGYVKQVGS